MKYRMQNVLSENKQKKIFFFLSGEGVFIFNYKKCIYYLCVKKFSMILKCDNLEQPYTIPDSPQSPNTFNIESSNGATK